MLDPDTDLFRHWTELHKSGWMAGRDRPISRVIIYKSNIDQFLSNKPGPWRAWKLWAPMELTYAVKSIKIDRSINQDAATMSLTMTNIYGTSTSPQGVAFGDTFGRGGFFTPTRGDQNPLAPSQQAGHSSPFPKDTATPSSPTVGYVHATTTAVLQIVNHPSSDPGFGGTPDYAVDQRFVKRNSTAEVTTIALTMPPGTTGQFRVGISNDPYADLGGAQLDLVNPRIVNVQTVVSLKPGVNQILLPQPVTLEKDSNYHLHLDPATPRNFNVTTTTGTPQTLNIQVPSPVNDPGYTPGENAIQHGQAHLVFDLLGAAALWVSDGVTPQEQARAMALGMTRGLGPVAISPGGSIYGPQNEYPVTYTYPKNLWYGYLQPNRVIQVLQGYGSDNMDEYGNFIGSHDADYVPWQRDSKMTPKGLWYIDKITVGNNFDIQIECRDVSKLLLVQQIYPPMIPIERFPLQYCPEYPDKGTHGTIGRNVARASASSSDPWIGRNGSQYGHRTSHAFDGNPGTYWMSVGNQIPNGDYSYEWIEGACGGNSVNQVVLNLIGSYTIFVAVMENGSWQGSSTVPYNPNSQPAFPNGSNVKYVMRATGSGQVTLNLPRTYKAQKVRVVFTNLSLFSYTHPYQYRAGVREMVVRNVIKDTFVPGTIGKPGYINDWSQVVKELCAWAGFTWRDAPKADPLLGKERSTNKNLAVWGDFENLGAPLIDCTPSDYFLHKSFAEGIRQVCEALGCVFFIDDSAGAVFRFPNFFSSGNFVNDPSSQNPAPYLKRRHPIEFHERANIIDYSVVMDDSQLRSEIIVVGTNPDINSSGYLAAGYDLAGTGNLSGIDFKDILAGQTRLFMPPGEQTAMFRHDYECQRMAELLGYHILLTYRKGSLKAPCHPGLQVDDQIRIFEHITNEYNIHYVSGISTDMDLQAGSWTMDVTTNWLGNDPDDHWFVNKGGMTNAVRNLPAIIKRLGAAQPGSAITYAGPTGTPVPVTGLPGVGSSP